MNRFGFLAVALVLAAASAAGSMLTRGSKGVTMTAEKQGVFGG